MRNIVETVIAQSGLGIYPAIGVVLLFGSAIGIYAWTFRPGSANQDKKNARLTLD